MIDIILGLPHLGKGALLARAKALACPILISANALSRWDHQQGSRIWSGWKYDQLRNAQGITALCLDSAGYTAMAAYGGYPWSADAYVALAAAYPFKWWAALDYCVEDGVARDREEVLDRIARTVRANHECQRRAIDRGIAGTFLPVIQGRTPEDYRRCADALASLIERSPVIGVGSMCRRPVHGPEGLVAVLDQLDRTLPRSCRLHLFGVKGGAIPYLRAFGHRVASVDSQAYGVSARRHAHRSGVVKTDLMVAAHMERWLMAQQAKLRDPIRALPVAATLMGAMIPVDAWGSAIAQAREQMRALIRSGDLDHDALTTVWVQEWAAALLQEWQEHANLDGRPATRSADALPC
ncbi:MAG: hypothetical protein QHC67_15210 [Sphingobium sp.]|uniref:deazapurine DNA modification protein DpdA family protein n=1 Tax=Sphingobium sp. TaxID=1912891 RepID=UPI0029BEE751|nr:hypothetical protein [Sphingobium sp.]MDX3911147.1 hypothetical protein [Sphingobium sp.]